MIQTAQLYRVTGVHPEKGYLSKLTYFPNIISEVMEEAGYTEIKITTEQEPK